MTSKMAKIHEMEETPSRGPMWIEVEHSSGPAFYDLTHVAGFLVRNDRIRIDGTGTAGTVAVELVMKFKDGSFSAPILQPSYDEILEGILGPNA